MPACSTVLLVSTDQSLIAACCELVQSIDELSLLDCHPRDVAAYVEREDVALVLVHLPEENSADEAAEVLQRVGATQRPVATLVLSDHYKPDQALALLRRGAADYLSRPLDLGRLAYLVDTLTLRFRNLSPAASPARELHSSASHGPSCALAEILERARLFAPYDSTILLGGETGSGKSRLARLIHQMSPRRSAPFVTVNCGSLAAGVVESELFGHAKAAFTGADRERTGKFATVGCGTLLLDDIDALPLPIQTKLLRAVEERIIEPVGSNKSVSVRARIIAASNQDLAAAVAGKRFRADLYYRLSVVELKVPPLRQHKQTIESLATEFAAEFASRNRRSAPRIAAPVIRLLHRHEWPGNIRELRNVIEHAVAMCQGSEILPNHLPESLQAAVSPQADSGSSSGNPPLEPTQVRPAGTLDETRNDAEANRILEALQTNRNNRLRAAAELGISRMTLYKKLQKYGLEGIT